MNDTIVSYIKNLLDLEAGSLLTFLLFFGAAFIIVNIAALIGGPWHLR